ncbi:MAG: phage holin family protein [Pirellulaceae bacterium]|nr:phage holin family protein [Pirellulaceae bacterium]
MAKSSQTPENKSSSVRSDIAELFRLRQKLLLCEIQNDVQLTKRCAFSGLISGLSILCGTSVLAAAIGLWLDHERLNAGNFPVATTIIAISLCLGGILIGLLTRKKLRREFSGLRHSIAEIKEDWQWLRELATSESK